MANDARQDKSDVFLYDFSKTPIAESAVMSVVNSVLSTITQNDAILGSLSMRQYSENADATLSQFADYSRNLPKGLSERQIERSVYDYVNNTIKYADPDASQISLDHNLEQAVAAGQGVCRDKSVALEYGLDAVGISAARVVTPAHVFVAILNSDGTVNHYLDPMYYENYVPLQGSNIIPGQIIRDKYSFSKGKK